MERVAGDGRLGEKLARALLWLAAFAFVFGTYLILEKHLRELPETEPNGVGRVTIDGESKLEDYAGAALFYLFVPMGTVLGASALRRLHTRATGWLVPSAGEDVSIPVAAIFAAAAALSPFFALTTRKEGWTIILPPLLAWGALASWRFARSRTWVAELRNRDLSGAHALILSEASAVLLFRYLVTGRRIAHIPTLLLELVFATLAILVLWSIAVAAARRLSRSGRRDFADALRALSAGSAPLLLLPVGGLLLVSEILILALILPLTALTIVLAVSRNASFRPRLLRNAVAYVVVPYLLFCVTMASTVALSQWVDLFHRGETLGPASDYLRGKVPYRDVFVLHGLLENGLLDAWLMEVFGRELGVASMRAALMSSLTYPAVWILGMIIFDSMPLALLVTGLGLVTFVDHQRALFQMIALLLLAAAIRFRRPGLALASGAAAAIALFFSLEIGLYSIAAGVATFAILPFVLRRSAGEVARDPEGYRAHAVRPYGYGALTLFVAGVLVGATPFLAYLGVNGALGPFFRDSFVVIPSIIDSVWSLPMPELSRPFRYDLTLRTFADFLLGERIRYVLNPLVIGLAMILLITRMRSRSLDTRDAMILAVTAFALLTQRSALGRADFQHQHFAAFLLAPIMVWLVVLAGRSLAPLWRSGDRGTQAFVSLLILGAIPLASTALWVPDLLNARLDDVTRYRPRISTIGFLDPKAKVVEDRIAAVRASVARLVKPGEPIFDFSNQPALYFFVDRPNPTRFYQVPILSPDDLQMEAITAIERARPAVVLKRSPEGYDRFDGIENELRAPALAAYLDDHYRYRETTRGIDLYVRRPGVQRAAADYRRHLGLPASADHSSLERVVIPGFGSIEGAAGSHWQSDLLLYNPHDRPVRLHLRYAADRDASERSLTLAPRKVVRMTDAARSFFALPRSRGSVTIAYRASAAPIIRSRTWDAARGGRAPLDRPLSPADAAVAGTPRDTITILGADGTWPHRVNLGIVATGDVPARVHISARTESGDVVGLPVETIVAEGEPYLLVDAGRPLGVPLAEDITVHIRVLSGAAVAWANVVDGSTGDQEMLVGVPAAAP